MSDLFASTITHELTHPITGEPTGLTLELIGQDHDDYHQAQIDVVKNFRKNGTTDPAEISHSIEGQVKVVAACIVGWTNTSDAFKQVFAKLGFTDDTFSKEKALALVGQKTARWVREQILTAIGDKERFFKIASIS